MAAPHEIEGPIVSMIEYHGLLLIATASAVYELSDGKLTLIIAVEPKIEKEAAP